MIIATAHIHPDCPGGAVIMDTSMITSPRLRKVVEDAANNKKDGISMSYDDMQSDDMMDCQISPPAMVEYVLTIYEG